MLPAAIVAGGRGVRMRPATDQVPKPMLPLAGKPLLEHQLEWLQSSGVRDVCLCLGYKAEMIRSHCGDGSRWGLKLRYQVEKEPRGTAGAVRDLGLSSDVLVVYGDLYVALDCAKLLRFHESHAAAATLVVHPSGHPLDSDLVRTEGDRITAFFRAAPGEAFENLACAAVWVLRPSLLELVPKDAPSDFGRDIFPAALAQGLELMAYRCGEEIVDIGTPERAESFARSRKWAAFLDRDGVLTDDLGLVSRPEDLRLLPGAAEAVRRLREAGALVVLATNQPVVARGLVDEEGLGRIHERLKALLKEGGAELDALYYCPHHPETHHPEASDPRYRRDCDCRKPKTGMLGAAARRLGIDISRSYFIGDSTRDIQTARNAGCRAVLVRTGNAGKDGRFPAKPDSICDDVLRAAEWVIEDSRRTARA